MNNKVLYSKSKTSKWKIWKASTDYQVTPKGIEITIQWGYEDGKQQTKSVFVIAGKNKGKSNETTIQEQATLKLEQLYQKQFDDDYVLDKESYLKAPKAMLAHKYKDKRHLVDWTKPLNCWASVKLNGIRCNVHVKDKKITKFTSRTFKDFKRLVHLESDLNLLISEDTIDCMFDGELYHPDIPFEILASLINNDEYCEVYDPDTEITWTTNDVCYYIYDYVDYQNINDNYFDRFIDYKGLLIVSLNSNLIHIVHNTEVKTEEQMKELATSWIDKGFEGLMLRHGSAAYSFGDRSEFLLKYKVMEQTEFKILDIYLAENDPTKIQILCENKFSNEEGYSSFDVGSVLGNKEANLLKYFNNKNSLIGKYLTVNYQALSKYNVPLFPVGVDIREGYINEDNEFVPEI